MDYVKDKSFDDLYRETHADPAYLGAFGSRMDYRDFLDARDPDREQKARFIEETAELAAF